MLRMEQIEGALRELSRDYSGDYLNAGVVLGTAIKKLRSLEGEVSEETAVEFQHGPVTITVTGLPECVLPASVHLQLGVHSVYHPEGGRVAAFAEDFAALGGVKTFPETHPGNRFSVASEASCGYARSVLRMYPPDATDPVLGDSFCDAIVTALDVDRHARDMRNELASATTEREAAQRVAGALRGIGERSGRTVREVTAGEDEEPVPDLMGALKKSLNADWEAHRLAVLVDLKIADIRAVDADAYGGFVADAAIRAVAHKTGEDWRVVLAARRRMRPGRDAAWSFPADARPLSAHGLAVAGVRVREYPAADVSETVFALDTEVRGSVQDAVDAERSRPVRPRQGGMPVAAECERGCVDDPGCRTFDPCQRLTR